MTSLAIHFSALVISTSLGFYFAVISVQSVGVVLNGVLTKRLPRGRMLCALCQNLGVASTLLGLTVQSADLAVVGILVIALGVLSGPGPVSALYSAIERALLIAALASLSCLGLISAIM